MVRVFITLVNYSHPTLKTITFFIKISNFALNMLHEIFLGTIVSVIYEVK